MKRLLPFFFILPFCSLIAQTNVRAWYADGQVWVVWEADFPLPETYAIYAKNSPFSDVGDATLIGRLFAWEYGAGALKEQVDTMATYRVPNGQGGIYQLALNEGLFVATPHQSGSVYFAVVRWGETEVVAGVNITDAAVPFDYNPVGDPVECHLQAVFPSPFAAGFTCFAFYLWADGRQNQWDSRPDFPVMANAAKNGMPSLFMISVPNDLDTSQLFPLTVWLHGGGGNARQSLAGSRPIINIKPEQGILLAHNDDLVGWRASVPPNPEGPSWHFGWRKNYDPFNADNIPTSVDTVVNYTQRRYLWIDQWLQRRFNIDATRININGHSMGGAGTTALAKCFPDHYASATIFNNGFGGPAADQGAPLFGPASLNFPTNLKNINNQTIGFIQLWNLIDNCSTMPDWPLIRCYHSKNDENDAMKWDAFVVENYRKTDSLGMGVQLFWSERDHGIDTGPDFNDHWHNGISPDLQTAYDDVAYEEAHFRSDTWLPAFFNHRFDPASNNPGDGTPGTGPNSSGDDWGTWGGYHRWEDVVIEDGFYSEIYKATVWLEDSSPFANDNCPVDQLTADMAVRRVPAPHETFCDFSNPPAAWVYEVQDISSGDYLDGGSIDCVGDDLMIIRDLVVYKKSIRKIKVTIYLIVPVTSVGPTPFTAVLMPNPAKESTLLRVDLQKPSGLSITLTNASGLIHTQFYSAQTGENQITLQVDDLSPGLYFVQIIDRFGNEAVMKMVKQ